MHNGNMARNSNEPVSDIDLNVMTVLAEGLKGTKESEYAQHWIENEDFRQKGWIRATYGDQFLWMNPNNPPSDYKEEREICRYTKVTGLQ